MGLLDALDSPDMGFALGLLQAGGPSRTPINLGQALGYGAQGYQEAKDRNSMRDFKNVQMEEYKAKQADSLNKRNALIQLREQIPEAMRPMFDVNPESFLAQLNKQQEEYTLTPGSVRYKGDKQIAAVPMQEKVTTPQLVQEIQAWSQMPNGPEKEMLGKILQAKTQGAQPAQPYYTPIPTEQGLGSFNNRSGQFSLVNGGGVVKPADSPAVQASLTGAKLKAEMGAKRDQNMSGLGDSLSEAEKLLSGKYGAKPTGSLAGAAVDEVASWVGASPKGAVEAQQLKALAGNLTAKMPRMEGPQSDKDVALYKEMAADVGNPMLPRERRLAALQTVKKLYQKYEKPTGGNVEDLLKKYGG